MILESRVFNNETTKKLFLNLPLSDIVRRLECYDIECPFTVKNGSNKFDLLQKRILANSIKDQINARYKELGEINELANEAIEDNPGPCADRKSSLACAYRELTSTNFFDAKLNIVVQQFDAPLQSFINQRFQQLNIEPINNFETMVTNVEGYLQLGFIIVEYIEQIESNSPIVSNKKQALDHGMNIDVNTQNTTSVDANLQSVNFTSNQKSQTNQTIGSISSQSVKLSSIQKSQVNSSDVNFSASSNLQQATGSFSMHAQKNNFPCLSPTNKNLQNSGPSASTYPRNSSSNDVEEEEELQMQLNQSLESTIEKIPRPHKPKARQLLITRLSDNGPVVTFDMTKCHLWSYLEFKATVIQNIPRVDLAAKIKFTDEQITAKLAAEQQFLYDNPSEETHLVQSATYLLSIGKCKFLRTQVLVDEAIDPWDHNEFQANHVLVTGIPNKLADSGELWLCINEIIKKAGLIIRSDQLGSLDTVNSCFPLADSVMQNGLPASSIQSLHLTLLNPITVTNPYLIITTSERYPVETNAKGQTVTSTVTIAINFLPAHGNRSLVRKSPQIATFGGPDIKEASLIAPFFEKCLHIVSDEIYVLLVPIYRVYRVETDTGSQRVTDTLVYFVVLGMDALTPEEIDNLRMSFGITSQPLSNNIVRVQFRYFETRRNIAEFDHTVMPRKVLLPPQICWEITGCREMTPVQVFEAIEQNERKYVAHVNVIPILSNRLEHKLNGTHRILVILKPPDLANPGRFNGDSLWFQQFRHHDGKLKALLYSFGLTEKEPTSYKNYNFYHLTRDFLDQKMSWASSSSSSSSFSGSTTRGYDPLNFEGLGFQTVQPKKSQKNVQINKSSYTPSVQSYPGFGKATKK